MAKTHEPIPPDFPVQPLKPGQKAEDKVTCGHCGLSWDDAISTDWTPAPSARCPFEYFHLYPDDDNKPEDKNVIDVGTPDWNMLEEMVERLGSKAIIDAVEIIAESSSDDEDDD